jgi:hypothetical protein
MPSAFAGAVTGMWQVTDVPGAPGGDISLVIDSSNNPHFCCYDYSNQDLSYFSFENGAWTSTIVDSGSDVGRDCSMCLDASQVPHIVYRNDPASTTPGFKYATKSGTSWTVAVVANNGHIALEPSIAVDQTGKLHVAFYDYDDEYLKYAVKDGDSWTLSTIDNRRGTGITPSIAVDGNGHVHISYYDGAFNELMYATNVGGYWQIETVAAGTGYASKIVTDSAGYAHIVCKATYYTNLQGSWQSQVIASSGGFPAMAIDEFDNLHVSYEVSPSTSRDLAYATKSIGVDTTWQVEILYTGFVSVTDVGVDSLGNVDILFQSTPGLKYATNGTPIPEFSALVVPILSVAITVMFASCLRGLKSKNSRFRDKKKPLC